MGIELNKSASDAAKSSIEPLYLSNASFGICINQPNQTQMAFELFANIEKYYSSTRLTDIYIYALEHSLPINQPMTALFKKDHLFNHSGPIVSTDPITTYEVLKIDAARPIFYVYDLMLLTAVPKDLIQYISQSKIKCFGQTDKHNEILSKVFGFNVINESCLEFDLDTLERIVRVYCDRN